VKAKGVGGMQVQNHASPKSGIQHQKHEIISKRLQFM